MTDTIRDDNPDWASNEADGAIRCESAIFRDQVRCSGRVEANITLGLYVRRLEDGTFVFDVEDTDHVVLTCTDYEHEYEDPDATSALVDWVESAKVALRQVTR